MSDPNESIDDIILGNPDEIKTQQPDTEETPTLEIEGSRKFTSWLMDQKCSLVFSTYQTGKLFMIGLQQDGNLSVFERTFERCMGLFANDQTVYMSMIYQIWKMENAFAKGEVHDGYDRLYVPQLAYTTGDIDIHDMIVDKDGQLIFVNTLFNCLATVSDTHSFKPLWKPKFISKLAAEDRCHLNGLAMRDGKARYVTAVSETDIHEGWREHRDEGGVVIDVESDEIICSGLSMPHSPRYYKDKIWLHNSGTGEFGYVDMDKGKFEPVCFCPGYLRGLSFTGDYAVAGISKPRGVKTFEGLALDDKLAEKKVKARCALEVINLKTGDIEHSLNIDGIVKELYDVVTLPGVVRPQLLGFKSEEIKHVITIDED